ncbi:hypothetical protein INS49_010662 [Diaporthe citri]|uniref:uncharacterized protein n=1 Tax=Diaporthe citri TaxID=83186 RepID=UPI001C81CE06|nr:uncharacterized protein INS49_010662 [Diaporthe citri]KAG6362432.1 hypothetical protein INS49_010662 [Diaporthe citri]
MKYIAILIATLAASVMAQNNKNDNCGFPDGPDCESVGEGASGLEQFTDPAGVDAGCCLLPSRCNNDGGERCERV